MEAMGATLKSRLPGIAAELRPRVGAAVKAGAEAIVVQAKAQAPPEDPEDHDRLHPGLPHLGDSIHAKRRAAAEYGVYANWYWLFSEFGTVREGARPYMLPAAEAEKEPIVAGIEAILRVL
jgi:HK97 gp10 family phage protein